jgi:hypothetical protein
MGRKARFTHKAREGSFFAGSIVPVKDFLDQTILAEANS